MRVNCKVGEPERASDTVVLVDVLRSSTSIVTLFEGGCDYVRPFKDPERAKEFKRGHEREEDIVLIGESQGRTVEGFDFNISPTNLLEKDMTGKVVFYRSSNLTRVLHACGMAEDVVIGGLINAKSVSDYLKRTGSDPLDLIACGISLDSERNRKSIVGLGEKSRLNELTIEDLIGVGSIIHYFQPPDLSDLGIIARLSYENQDWREEIKNGFIYSYLTCLGYSEDLEYCLQENVSDLVPVYNDGRIKVE